MPRAGFSAERRSGLRRRAERSHGATTGQPPPLWPCPCCGYVVFGEPPGSFEICPVCGWEDDLSQLRFASSEGGANALSLLEAQADYARKERQGSGGHGGPPPAGYVRDPGWRRLDPYADHIDIPEPGRDYGRRYADDSTTLYYWRQVDPKNWRLDISQACIDLYLELSQQPRPLSHTETAMMLDLVDAWRALEHRWRNQNTLDGNG